MFKPVTPHMREALETSLVREGVTPGQFTEAQRLATEAGERMATAYGEVVGREISPPEFARDVLGIEGTGHLLIAALREVTGRAGLYRDLL
ncbi:hypothetical protein [Streptomyces luteolus]|uniref:Uncharacterized protein n=1 Tax=Streptomyces luteolus TaxID=3043615 RepID=A0ABT6SQY4_9ACTN|nr:hypothetical protein [Streptomyces sp. B-S-A12]MDI3418001.1 hypothetical protein [Streptomyces sp. B-S-A12]